MDDLLLDVLAGSREIDRWGRVWGTGGWLMPEYREALDWATLGRLFGWAVRVTTGELTPTSRWIILALPPENVEDDLVEKLAAQLDARRVLVITRAGQTGTALARLAGVTSSPGGKQGLSVNWVGPGPSREWSCRKPIRAHALSLSASAEAWATLDGEPIVAARPVGRGIVATLAFHPSEARDRNGAATALLRHLMVRATGDPVAWLDFEETLVLRMDDPGGAQNVHSRSWSYPKLGEAAWEEIGRDLRKRHARLSIGYVAGWVDDGEPERGSLTVNGDPVPRVPGAVHPSMLVTYTDSAGTIHDYAAEFRGIQELRAAGLAEVELHGYTHIHPDRSVWLSATDRYESVSWYRELGYPWTDQNPLEAGLTAFEQWFHARPSALICPGDQWSNEALECAVDLGFDLVSSYYLGIRDSCRLLWASHVCAPYLDKPDAAWFDSGLPVIGYFHDRELAIEGVAWMSDCLEHWQAVGAKRFMDLRELAVALRVRIAWDQGTRRLVITSDGGAVQPLAVGIYSLGIGEIRTSVDLARDRAATWSLQVT